MKKKNLLTAVIVLAFFLSLNLETVRASTNATVYPANVGVDWFPNDTRAGGNATFISVPSTAPLGSGSLQMTTTDTAGGSSQAKAQLFNYQFGSFGTPGAGVALADIDGMSYWAYRASTSTNPLAQTISLNMEVDYVGDGSSSTTLVFEPVYQAGGVGAMLLDTWQEWDAYNGGNGVWWSTKAIPGVCAFTCYVSWDTIIANNPNAEIKFAYGFNVGSGWVGEFQGYADALKLSVLGDVTTFDFEPPCNTTCYVDAVNGNDANGGTSVADALQTIQAAIDQVDPGGEVRVLPGNYSETATNRWVLGTNGPHQFGLFIDKNDVTIQGVDASDVPITDYNALDAYVTTNATNNFGYSGIFVQGDNLTIAGLHIGPNTPSDNKTIEIIGDGFTLKDSHINVPGGGSVYFNDWQFDAANDVSHVQSYIVDHNLIDQSTSIDIASGAGYSGPVAGRQITNNEFLNADYWPSISFNGSGTGVPWFVYSVGGAVIENNVFTNTFNETNVTAGHIRARGVYDNSQFDWTAYWNNNAFNKAVVILDGAYPPFNVREYNYTSGSYSFDVRRIGVNIQGSIDKAVSGDTVLVRDGTYNESPNVNKPLTLKSWMGRDVTFIQLQTVPTYLGSLTINTAGTTIVDGFTILGFDAVGSGLASSNIVVTTLPDDVTITNNRIKVGMVGAGSNGDDGMGLITYYNTSSDIGSLTVTNNIFEPLNAEGQRAFYINPGVMSFLFKGNLVQGKFNGTAITQAKDGLVEENTLVGTGAVGSRSRGFGTWGYPDPTLSYGVTTFRNNEISGTSKGIAIYDTNNVTVENNYLFDNGVGVWIGTTGLTFDPSTILITENSIVNHDDFGVENAVAGTVDATINWWNSADGPQPTGMGDEVSGDVNYTPWLCVNVDTSSAIGYQPLIQTDCAGPLTTNVLADPNPAGVDTSVTLTANVDDSTTGGSTIASAEYNLDGGAWMAMVAQDGSFDEINEDVSVGITAPSEAGIYDLCVRGTDSAGNTGVETCVMWVVYDPDGGFVTGGGWIDSPPDAMAPVSLLVWDQGFETNTDGWFDSNSEWYGLVSRVSSGTNGITSSEGTYHAIIEGDADSAPFTRFDNYRDVWPGTWVAEIDIYLDPAWMTGQGFDYSVAATGSDGNHQRDYIFHVTKDTSTGMLLVAGSNNTNFAPREDLENINHYEVTNAGWYTFQHVFYDQAGALAVDLNLLDANGNVLFTETRYNAADLIPQEVGGNRYGWFTFINVAGGIAADEHQLIVPVGITGTANFGFVSKYKKGAQVPTGNTEFVFQAGDLNFHSTSYDWLVVTGSDYAKFKGFGTLNGELAPNGEEYKFMVWAGDGNGSNGEDTFRMKIWWEDGGGNEVIVYDNGMDQPIGGGNIVVHK